LDNRETGIDGRRMRSDRTKRKISNGLEQLLRGGNLSPTADELARASGISLRTIYRHYEDIESLYRELAAQIDATILPVLLRPYKSVVWQEQLQEAVERRYAIFEHILPLKAAADLRRYRSSYLMDVFKRSITLERTQLEAVIPENVENRVALVRALEPVISFSAWKRMRIDQGLSFEEARDTMLHILNALVPAAGLPGDRPVPNDQTGGSK
jgi:AcrR family transcriptional regulator